MGMTIDKSFEWLVARKEHYEMDDNCQELAQALDVAINTMRKYQKIQEIVIKWQNEPKMKFDTSYYNMAKIIEVLEDGNDD